MTNSILIQQEENKLQVNSDSYNLKRVIGVQAKVLNWKNHLSKIVAFGLMVSSILFVFLPCENQEYGLAFSTYLPIIGFVIGAVLAILTSRKYEFRIKYNYADDTGIQWLTVAKSNKSKDYKVFQEQEIQLKNNITL